MLTTCFMKTLQGRLTVLPMVATTRLLFIQVSSNLVGFEFILCQTWHFYFHIWQRSDVKADYGPLWNACTTMMIIVFIIFCFFVDLGSTLLASKPPTLPGARLSNGTRPVKMFEMLVTVVNVYGSAFSKATRHCDDN